MNNTAENEIPWEALPAFSSALGDIPERAKRAPGERLVFGVDEKGFPEDLRLEPFYRVHFQRYAVYWKRNAPGKE